MSDDLERVELDDAAVDRIASRLTEMLGELKSAEAKAEADPESDDSEIKALRDEVDGLKAAMAKPQRTELPDTAQKSGEHQDPVYYGGDDKYTALGETDADIATNLYIVKTILDGNPAGSSDRLSPRGREVMVKAAEKALKGTPREVKYDTKQFSDAALPSMKADRAAYYADARKAMVSTTSGSGDEWVPTLASAELWTEVHLATAVTARFPRVAMPTNPFTLPTLTSDPTFYYASTENTAVTGSNPGTGNATLTARKIQADVTFSGETSEDSIIAIAPTVRSTLVRRAAQTMDDLIVHGDTETGGTGNVNSDDGAPTAGTNYLAIDGLRKFTLVTNTGQGKNFSGSPTTTLYLNTKALLGKYGARPRELIAITGQSTIDALMDITGVKLVYEYGPNATILTGELGQIFGTPILLSEAIPGTSTDKVDDDGLYTTTSPSTNDTDGWIVLTNPSQWRVGFRRDLQLETDRNIQTDSNILVASFRMAFIPSGIDTAHTSIGYNITL